ncbi:MULTISPECIES: response regulator transcription factor [Streptomyces]|uniref:DNA-binding response regulator n=1 Tax=Streptomyces tsukubensis (strain DSM 42081 / NBRC 108919 / NRRL 18488 / 9993) TaxID=1114943 RepID=I2NB12_STRT9|nr:MULTISPECIES: response regulator transcription factor [Streptomyces]AZK97973.1 DNA-binding response regulator [Streptomyces tsukubensis]EIF94209.1 putative two-component system response regulator [Streptomyces tsukubensis NRRL18488]MYS64458.1 response regulator [Streptomyces sp. SID5473]QKM66103.1 DNA-binding response regulator [Streptomyces tsukubensis NRRL18488]TAI42386.1 response regulator transcription factor [Streptomyces tsukubensis]
MPRVLLIEDDPSVREGVELGLRRRGHEVTATATGEEGLAALPEFRPDLVLLDLMLPGVNGVEVCRRIREAGQLPIIMLTARGDDFDIVIGLEAGADDYIVKPARTEVIEARIRAVLRRIEEPGAGRPTVERHGDLALDRSGLTVTKCGQELALAPSELKLLLYLSAAPEQVFSRQQLLEQVWEHGYHGDARLVDACVRRLRNKIEDVPGSPRYIQTLRGFGYRFGPL